MVKNSKVIGRRERSATSGHLTSRDAGLSETHLGWTGSDGRWAPARSLLRGVAGRIHHQRRGTPPDTHVLESISRRERKGEETELKREMTRVDLFKQLKDDV
ncbi:unnamed protein product [Pleuronectes platessa]|uniref:Uncharacterized protein n=1 Tax=Pleuronectes platessa TaxID=8262 RepID=A0A9N7YCU3_PLEPL|nr:unnamed protein product [Pleuronectes platessa]